jgi:hypothetical protein
MLLVIPVSASDASLIDPVSKVISCFGPYPLHQLLVVGSASNWDRVNELSSKLGPLFKSVGTYKIPGEVTGWPKGPNHYFRATVSHLFENSMLDQPWYWFELDNTPLKPGWLDSLQVEYNLQSAVYMGVKHPTFYVDPNDNLVVRGHHMCGSGVYPKDFVGRSVLWRYDEGVAFDIWIQWEVVPSLHDTHLMQHNWKTQNYRRENGAIVCDPVEVPHPELVFNLDVREDAVVLHGCKDGSLARIVLDDLSGAHSKKPSPTGPSVDSGAATPSAQTDELVFPKERKRRAAKTVEVQ